ncbi:MAG: G5 domain-containing protein, partial [Peptoniphilus harei]|nr:G5 domain-containing protein [Peptoniphilus harei]
APVNEVIVVGTKVAENNKDYNNDVDVEIEYVKDNSKYVGYVEKGELTKGHVETKIVNKFDPATGKIITTEEEVVTPAKQKITVGTKDFTGEFSHKIEKTLPFETEIQYDDTMEAGTKEVSQTGQTGQSEQTVTQKYTNGVLANKEYTDEVTTKEPVKEIVKIGTKPVEKIVEIPFNTEYVYDNTIDAGTVQDDPANPGANGSVTVKTYFDKESGKFVSVEDADSKVAPVNKIVRVGTKPNNKMCPVPEEPTDPTNPSNPGGNDNPSSPGGNDNPSSQTDSSNSSNPGGNDSGTPGTTTDKPVTPGTPGETPNKPVDPNKPVEPGKLTEEKTPEGKTPEDKKFEGEKKISDSEKSEEVNKTEKAEKSQDEKELVKEEKAQEEKFVANKVLNRQAKNDDRAPKTADAGLVTETASAGLASGLLLLLGRRKRRKEEENKKNK